MAESKCLGQNIQLSLDALIGAMSAVIDNFNKVEQASTTLANTMSEIKQIIKHYHDSHLHASPHDPDIYEAKLGKACVPNIITPADKLLHEYNTNFDVDGNGLIYGKDFKITDDTAPQLIARLNEKLNLNMKMTMDQYINTIPNHEKIWTR